MMAIDRSRSSLSLSNNGYTTASSSSGSSSPAFSPKSYTSFNEASSHHQHQQHRSQDGSHHLVMTPWTFTPMGDSSSAGSTSTTKVSLTLAERVASFLSLNDLIAYFSLEKKARSIYEAYGQVRDCMDKVLGSLSLIRLIEWGIGVISRVAHAGITLVVGTVQFVAGCAHAIISQILGFIDYLIRLAHYIWRELRVLSVREMVRTLLILLSDKLERDMNHMGSQEGDLPSQSSGKGGGLSGMGSSLKMSFLNSFKQDFEDLVGGGGGSHDALGLTDGDWGTGMIPQRNAGLGRPSSKMGLVVAYRERNETLSSLTKQKVRRMMHYQVPLKPFDATIVCQGPQEPPEEETGHGGDGEDIALFPSVMCTPQSFPPTPISRACVMARFSQFSDDVVYLARDQLRLEELVKADDDVTKMAAQSLKQQACLAVFNSEDTANGIVLSCGGHCATKVGTTTLYTSTRAMVPIMRNRHVFFQMSIMAEESAVASLCVGLSTPEMPLNTLVGSWKYSIGLCSTGQILVGSRWYGCATKQSRFGCGCTVGVLVHIDECRSSESWDGELVEAFVKFSVNGVPVTLGASEGHPGGDVTTLFIPKDDDIYPTLTLHSPSTQVLGRFCAADILYPHRTLVGAPPGVPVYALDGSVILRPDEEVGHSTI